MGGTWYIAYSGSPWWDRNETNSVRIFANLIKDINIRGWLSPRPNEAIPREGLVSLLNPQSKRSQKRSGKTVAKVGKWDLSTETSAQKIQNDVFNVLCLKNKQNETKRNKDKPVNCSRKSAFQASCRAAASCRVFFRAVGITQQEGGDRTCLRPGECYLFKFSSNNNLWV